jgi:AcrR family transcriptional regulator
MLSEANKSKAIVRTASRRRLARIDEAAGATSTLRYLKKRDAIIAAAAAILNRRGARGMTLADVAASVGLITTSVTYYFKRKEDLAAACFLSGIARRDALISEALLAPTPQERLRRFIGLHLDLDTAIRRGLAPPIAVLSDVRALTEPNRSQVAHAYGQLFRKVRSLFHAPGFEWLNRRLSTARTYMLMEQVFWSAAWLPRYDLEDYPRVGERMFDILVNGLALTGAQWRPAVLDDAIPPPLDAQAMSRETFLLAATRLINREGYRGASVEKISAVLNVTKGSFYHHNDAKDDLVVDCFERSFEVVRRVQSAAMRLEADQWTRLSAAAKALVEHQLSDQGPLLRTSALSALPEAIRRDMVEQSNRLSERFAAMIADGVAEGTIRAIDPMIGAQMLNATLNAAADLRHSRAAVKQAEVAELYAKPMLMGVFSR